MARPPKLTVPYHLFHWEENDQRYHRVQFNDTKSFPFRAVQRMCTKLEHEGIFTEVSAELYDGVITVYVMAPPTAATRKMTEWRKHTTTVIKTMVIAYQHGNQSKAYLEVRRGPNTTPNHLPKPRRKRRSRREPAWKY